MAKKVNVVGKQPKRVRVDDEPRRRIDPAEMAAALGADANGEYIGANLDPISLAELGNELLRRLRSTGGRPALSDATEFCRVPLSAEDVKALEEITAQIEQSTGTKPSPGQLVSVIVRQYLRVGGSTNAKQEDGAKNDEAKNPTDFVPSWLSRLADIVNQASALQKTASDIECAAEEMKNDIGEHLD